MLAYNPRMDLLDELHASVELAPHRRLLTGMCSLLFTLVECLNVCSESYWFIIYVNTLGVMGNFDFVVYINVEESVRLQHFVHILGFVMIFVVLLLL